MIDVHSHILPHIDDGSRSVAESIAILRKMAEQKIDTVVATPHFYANEEPLEQFLHRRERAFRMLSEEMRQVETPLPGVIPGAEVWYFEGVSHSDSLRPLCTEGTDVLLLEMPFSAWTEHMIQEIISLHEHNGFTVLLAHVDRYLKWQKRKVWDRLSRHEILLQFNAEAFLERRTSRKALKLLDSAPLPLIGSDCHNSDTRPPNLEAGMAKIRESLGENAVLRLERTEKLCFSGTEGVS